MIIKSIEIKHFRCFNQTKGYDFGSVNLLGGKNNAGKTALLEALYLMNEPSHQSISSLMRLRREDFDSMKSTPQKAWENLFFQGNKGNNIVMSYLSDDADENKREVEINCNESIEEFLSAVQKSNGESDTSVGNFANYLTDNKVTKSALHINAYFNEKNMRSSVSIATPNGVMGASLPFTFKKTHLIPAGFKVYDEDLTREFGKAKLEESDPKLGSGSDILLKAFQLIDKTIQKVETINIGKPAIYLKREGEKFMPLIMYGDAMNKIADLILRIVNNRNSLILIDEIENGIHFSNQKALWKMIFDLVKAYDIQFFATSHSKEMIEAFAAVAIDFDYTHEARYFVLDRHVKTNEITIQKMSLDVLDERLSNNKTVRG